MSISVLPQLLEVDFELSAQASALESRLNELKEKRVGIQTVIEMFGSGAVPDLATAALAASDSSTAQATKATQSSKVRAGKLKTSKLKKSKAKTSKAATPKAAAQSKSPKATKAKATGKLKTTRGRPAAAKSKPAKAVPSAATTAAEPTAGKRSGRTADWQRYVQDSYSKAALPDVIVGVLQAQPSSIFKIADVMNVVFKEDMPKSQFLKARNRVSNILSAGARDGNWYRGRGGTYSASEKAIKKAAS
ncbi:MAG: hypothetical protein WBA76_22290 [Phormidesmis sp.]